MTCVLGMYICSLVFSVGKSDTIDLIQASESLAKMMLSLIVKLCKRVFGRESNKERFSRYAKNNKWRDNESLSGPGSTLFYAEMIRRELPVFLKEYSITSIFDAPCRVATGSGLYRRRYCSVVNTGKLWNLILFTIACQKLMCGCVAMHCFIFRMMIFSRL